MKEQDVVMSYPVFAFVGTYTENIQTGTGRMLEGKARGIHIFRFDSVAVRSRLSGWLKG